VPTGVALRDARNQLFDAAERVLLRDGMAALTSRSVTTEAGCAKGVLHRHFADFDAFLAELVYDRISRVEAQAVTLREQAGRGTITDNLAVVLTDLFGSVAGAIVGLIIARDAMRARLRQTHPTGIPLLTEAGAMLVGYLTLERDLGRIRPDADLDTLAPTLIAAGYHLYAGHDGTPPRLDAVRKIISVVIIPALA
jgi:AcrR family transcriptional regulator